MAERLLFPSGPAPLTFFCQESASDLVFRQYFCIIGGRFVKIAERTPIVMIRYQEQFTAPNSRRVCIKQNTCRHSLPRQRISKAEQGRESKATRGDG